MRVASRVFGISRRTTFFLRWREGENRAMMPIGNEQKGGNHNLAGGGFLRVLVVDPDDGRGELHKGNR